MHRALHRFYFSAFADVTILESFDFVLRNVVIADRRRIFPDDRQLADFARQMVTGFDRRHDWRAAVAIVFENNQRLIIHLFFATHKVAHHGVHTSRRASEQKTKQIDEMNAVGKRYASIAARTFEAAKVGTQHFDFAKATFGY